MMKTPDELKARELGTSSFVAGVIQPVEELRTQYNSLSQLYQQDALTNSTRKNELYRAMGIAPNQQLPTGIAIPKGFEIDYKLVQHENDVQYKYNQYLDGQMGYDTFLYEAYGRDILKTQGHDLKNPLYWYSQRQKGITESPIDNPVILKSLLNQAEDLFKLENFYQRLTIPLADTSLAGLEITAETMSELFSDQEELANQLGSWEKVLTSFRAGTLANFDPLKDVNDDNQPDYYLHTDGKLYALTEDEELAKSSSYARIVRKANGEIDRISISGSDVGDFFKELWTGFINGVSSIVDLGGLVFAAGESLVTGESYGDAYNNYLAWRNAWAPESNVYQVSKGGADDWIFGFASAAGTIAGFLALSFATAGLGSIGGGVGAAGKVAPAAVKSASVLSKVGSLAAKTVAKSTKVLINLNSGIPFSAKAIGVSNVMQRAAMNFAVEGVEMFANAKARQAQTGLTDEDIILRTMGAAGVNAALTVFLNGGTDDMGAVTRMGLLASKKTIKKSAIKDLDKALSQSGLGTWLLRHPRLMFTGNVLADTVENALTMNIRTTFYRTGGDFEAKDVVQGMFEPQALASLGFMTLSGAKGFMGNEGMRTYGAIQTSKQIGETYTKIRGDFETRLIEAERNTVSGAEANAVSAIIQKMDADYTQKTKSKDAGGEGKLPAVAMLEILDEMHAKSSDGQGGKSFALGMSTKGVDESFVTRVMAEVIKDDINTERAKMQRAILFIFERRVEQKQKAYNELLTSTSTKQLKFYEEVLNKVPLANGKVSYDTYSKLYKQAFNAADLELKNKKLEMAFREELDSLPGGQSVKDATEHINKRSVDYAKTIKKFFRIFAANDEAMMKDFKEPGTGKDLVTMKNNAYLEIVKVLKARGRTDAEAVAKQIIEDGVYINIKLHETSGDSASDQKAVSSLIKAYEILEKNQDEDFPHIIKVSGAADEATYIFTGDMSVDFIQRQLAANKFVQAVMLLRSGEALSSTDIDAAIKVMASVNSKLDETAIPSMEQAKIIKQLYDQGILNLKTLTAYIHGNDTLRNFYRTNESLFPDDPITRYVRSLEVLEKLQSNINTMEKIGIQKNITRDFGENLKELEKYNMMNELLADGKISQKQFELYQQQAKLNFPQLLSSLEEGITLLKSSSIDNRNADAIIKYLISKFGDDQSLEVFKIIEDEIMNESTSAERSALVELRQRLGDDQKFNEVLQQLADTGIIEMNAVTRVPNIVDLLDALRGNLSREEILKVKKLLFDSKPSAIEDFINKYSDKKNLKLALTKLGYYKKDKTGFFIRTLKNVSYEEFIAELESVRKQYKSVDEFLNNIQNVKMTKPLGEIFLEAIKNQFPELELSDLTKDDNYIGIMDQNIFFMNNKDETNNVNPYNNNRYNKRIEFYEWLLEGDNLERFIATDSNKKGPNGEAIELIEFRKTMPEELRDYANIFFERDSRVNRFTNGVQSVKNNPLEGMRKVYTDVIAILKEQQKNKKPIDREKLDDDVNSLEKSYTLNPKQLYEESIRNFKSIPTIRSEVSEIIGNERITNVIMDVMYDRMNAEMFTILEPNKVIDAIIATADEELKINLESYKTKDHTAKKEMLKSRINAFLEGSISKKVINAAVENYMRDNEGAKSFYEYANLKNIKTQTAIELEKFYNAYVNFTFDNTNEINVNDIIVHVNLEELLPYPFVKLQREMRQQNKPELTTQDLDDIKANLGIRDADIISTLKNRNKIFNYYEGSSPIIEFNLSKDGQAFKEFINNYGYDFDMFVRDNYEGIVGINAIKPGARGILLGDTYFGADVLKVKTSAEFKKQIDTAKELYVAFHNIVWMNDDTIINPRELMGSYIQLGDDPEILNGYVNVMYDELLGKLGKAGSLKDGATLSEAFTGLNVRGQVDEDLKNFMLVEWLYNTIEKYVGQKGITEIGYDRPLKINNAEAARIRKHGWILQKDGEVHRITGYKKPESINIKSGDKILLNEILPSEFELKEVEIQGILNKMSETYDENRTTLMSPSDIAFLKQEYDGQNELLDRVKNKQFTLSFKKDLNNDEIKLPRANMTVKEVKTFLEEKAMNNARGIMLLNKLNAATKISTIMAKRLEDLSPENVDGLKVAKLMQNKDFIELIARKIKSKTTMRYTDSDAEEINRGIAGLRIPEADSALTIKYSYNKGFASARLNDATVMTGEEFRLLNPKVDYEGMTVNKQELDYIEAALKSIFTDYRSDDTMELAEQNLRNTLASFVFKDSKGNYHLGVGAAESLFMFDYDEQIRQILPPEAAKILIGKINYLRNLYPNARNKVQIDTERAGVISQGTATAQRSIFSGTVQDKEAAKELLENQLKNRYRSNDIFNAKDRYIKASQAQNRVSNEYNNLFKNMLDYQSKLVSTKVSDPSRSMVLNMQNQLATGEMIKTIDDIARTISENGVIKPFGKNITNDAIYDLATEIYMLSSNNFKQSEYAKYLIVQTDEVAIRKVQGLNGEMIDDPEGRTEIKKFYASNIKHQDEESLIDLYRTMRELDPNKEYAVFVLDRNDYLTGRASKEEGAQLKVINFKDYDRATNESKGYTLFRDMAIEALRIGKDVVGNSANVVGNAEEYIKLALSSKMSKMRLINNYKSILRSSTKLNNEQIDALFYTFLDTDVTSPFRTINEEALFRTLHQSTERKLYDVDANNYTNRVTGVIKTGINIDEYNDADDFRLSLYKNKKEHIHKDYVDGIINGQKVNLKLGDNPEDINKIIDIFYDYMVRADDLDAIKFIVKSSFDETNTMEAMVDKRAKAVKDSTYNGKKLTELGSYKKVYLDMETVVPNRGVDAETYPFQIGLVYEVNGAIKRSERINITLSEYKELVDNPNYSGFKDFIYHQDRSRLRSQINKNAVSNVEAVNKVISFIENVRQDDHSFKKDEVIIIAHNGKEADFKWLGNLFDAAGKSNEYKKYQNDFVDTYEILQKFPVLGFNSGEALESIKHNVDALSEISFLAKDIEELKQLPEFNSDKRAHDAMDDAGLLSVIGRHIFKEDSFISMDNINTNLIKTLKMIAEDVGLNVSTERLYQILKDNSNRFKFNIEKDPFAIKVNSLSEIKDTDFKLMIDTVNDYMLTMDNLYSRKEIYGEFGKDIKETAELRKALGNNGNIKLDKIMTYVVANLKNAEVIKKDLTDEQEANLIKNVTSIFYAARNTYGDFNPQSNKGTLNAKMFDRMVIQALGDGDLGTKKFFEILNASTLEFKEPLSIEKLNEFSNQGASLGQVLKSLEDKPESYLNKMVNDSAISRSGNALLNALNVISKDILSNINDVKGGQYKNFALRVLSTLLNENIELSSREYAETKDILKRLNTVTFRSSQIKTIEDMIKTGIPIHQLTMKRYWGLVTAFSKSDIDENGVSYYKLTTKDGKIKKITENQAGTIIINKDLFETMFGMDETKYRENLKLKEDDPLYLTAIRYPADKIDPLYGYKVIVDYDKDAANFIRMTASDIQRHSGDFDGDKLVLVKPTVESQEYYSKGMLELMNKPYQALEALREAIAPESYFKLSKEKYEARVLLSHKFEHNIQNDLKLLKDKTHYETLLDKRIEEARALFQNDSDVRSVLTKAGYTEQNIKDLVMDAWIERVDLEFMKLGKEEFIVNNSFYDGNVGPRKAKFAQQKLAFPAINFKDSVTGYIQKLQSASTDPDFFLTGKEFGVDKLQYRSIVIPSFVKEAIRNQIGSDSKVIINKLKQTIDADILKQLDIDNLNEANGLSKVQTALHMQEAKIRLSKEFEDTLVEGIKVTKDNKDIRIKNQELIDMFNDMTQGVLDDGWINYGKNYNSVITRVFENMLRKNPNTRTKVVSEDDMIKMVNKENKIILIDDEMIEEKGSAVLRKEYGEANPTYRSYSIPVTKDLKQLSKNENFVGIFNRRAYFVEAENLSNNVKLASIGNEAMLKSTVYKVVEDNIKEVKLSDGTSVNTSDVAMYVSRDAYNQIPKGQFKGEVIKVTVDGKEYDAIRTNLSVVENQKAFPNFIKEEDLDMLVFSHSRNTALEPVMFGDVNLKYDEATQKIVIDQKLSYEMTRLRENLKDPVLIASDASSMYYNLIFTNTISKILNNVKKLSNTDRESLRSLLARHEVESSYKNNNIINASLTLINEYFGKKYFNDERSPMQRFHSLLNQTEKKLFSLELYEKIHPTVVTSIKDYDKMMENFNSDGIEGLIISKSSKLPILQEKGQGLEESFAYYTSDMLLDTSKGFVTQPGYISKLEFLNFFLEDGKKITQSQVKTLYKEGLLERGQGYKGTYESGWNPFNAEDIVKQRNVLEDPKNIGLKSGAGNTNPGTLVRLNNGSFDFSKNYDFKLENYREGNERFTPSQERFLNYFKSKSKDRSEEEIRRSNTGTILKRLVTSLKSYDNELDRVTDYNIELPKNVVFYKNPKQLSFDDDGNVDLKYSYAPSVKGTIGDIMKFSNDKSLTSFGYNIKNQQSVDPRISSFEKQIFNELEIIDPLEANAEFYVDLIKHNSIIQKQAVLEDEYANDVKTENKMQGAVHEPLKGTLIKMKKDILSTSGVGGTEAYDVKLQNAITRLGRDQRMIYADLMSPATLLKSLMKNGKDIKDFNEYMSMKMYNYLLLETEKDSTQQQTVLMNMRQNLGIETREELKNKILSYSDSHRKEAAIANVFVTRVHEMGEQVANETGQVSPKIFQIIRPIKHVDANENKRQYVHTLKTIFNIGGEVKDTTIDQYLPNKEYNFMHSMDVIIDSMAKIKAAKNLSNNLKELGALDNDAFISQSNTIFMDEFSKMKDDPNTKYRRNSFYDIIESMLGNKFVIDKNAENGMYKLFSKVVSEIEAAKEGQNYTYKNIDELRRYVDETGDVVARDILTYEEVLEDIKYEAIIENPEMQKRIIERVRSIAETNDASLVNEFGQLYPRSNTDDFFKPIANFDTSFLLKNLSFVQSGETYEQRMALAAITGRLYMMDSTTAKHLNDNFYTKKVPSNTLKLLNNISAQSTKFIMSSLPQLANRMFNFSMFDYGIMASVDPAYATKIPRAIREFSALMQSNGKILDSKEYAELTEFIKTVGLDPTKMTGLDVVQFQEKVKTPKFLDGYFQFTDKALQAQTLATRYALYLHVKESFDKGKGVYGSAYFKKEGIDALPTSAAKAMMVVDETLGSPGAFPFAAKYTQGWAMFATFPLALIRYGLNNTRTIGRVMKEIYMGESDNAGIKQLAKSAVGLTGVALLTNLTVSLVSDIFGVDEETEEEWKKDQVLFKPLQTLLFGKPYVQYGQSANPLKGLEEMLIAPFTEKDNDTLSKKLVGLINQNILGKLNPVFKVPAEVLTNKDFFGPTPITTSYSWEDNLARKFAGYIIGIGGANAMVDSWRYSRLDQEDPTFVDRLGASMKAALVGEIGNNKGYKAELKNYYNAMSIINGYRAAENKDFNANQLSGSSFNSEVSFKLAKDLRKAMNDEQRPSVIYGLINEAIENGAGKNEILYALRSNSIMGRLAQVKNQNDFYASLNEKERVMLMDAANYESKNYSILKELLQETSTNSYNNRYVRNYVPRVYANNPRDPRYIYNPRYYPPRTPYKPKKQPAQLQRRNMFVPRLSDATGSRAEGITGRLKVKTTPQSFVGIMGGMAIRKPYQDRIARSLKPRVRAQENPKVFDHRKVFKE